DELERLCSLHRSLGVPDDDHVIRPIVRRGRATDNGMGIAASPDDLFPELTITADGSFWSPFGPTVSGGRLDTDLMVTRRIEPLSAVAKAFVRLADARPQTGETSRFR